MLRHRLPSRVIRYSLIAGLIVVLATSCATRNPRLQVVSKVEKAIVQIGVRKPWGKFVSVGTGFFVAEDKILTAGHVAETFKKERTYEDGVVVAIFRTTSGETVDLPILVDAVDHDNDVALYRVSKDAPPVTPAPLLLDARDPLPGEDIAIAGFNDGHSQPFFDFGTIAMMTSEAVDLEDQKLDGAVFSNVAIFPGHSGGPLISVNDGKVVAINVGNTHSSTNGVSRSLSTRAVHALRLLNSSENQQ